MIAPRPRVDVSDLPDFDFDHRDTMWWGTTAFVAIEGMTLLVCLAAYFYLSRNFTQWPPPPTPLPGLGGATLATGVALLSVIPAVMTARRAREMHSDGVRTALVAHALVGLLLVGLRAVELLALRTRWDTDAYGSIVWMVLGVHTTLVLTDLADTILLTVVFLRGREENKHFPGVVDNATYWNFVVATWVVVYAVVYLSPRIA